MVGLKHRLRFEKAGDLRLLSHLDLLRSVERLCRRAEVPFAFTNGFHPGPKIVFALSLSLGIVGRNEVLEIETTTPFEPEDLRNRLNTFAPIGLTFKSAKLLEDKAKAMPRRSIYRLPLDLASIEPARDAVAKLLLEEKVWVPRLKPRPRQVNVKPYLRQINVENDAIYFDLWVTQSGTARTDELIVKLGLPSPLDTGAIVERLDIELHDETPADVTDAPPSAPADLKPLEHSPDALSVEAEPATAAATWGLSPEGPEVE